MTRPCGCRSDVVVFGHTGCDLAPPWLVSERLFSVHAVADWHARSRWAVPARRQAGGR